MDSSDMVRLERKVRLKYELGRARRALVGFSPALIVVVAAALIGHRPASALAFGAPLFVLGALLLWYGRDLRRAVLPGVVAGIVPLTLALCASHLGHVCTGERCMTMCIPACTLGGLLAGLGVAAIGHRGKHGIGFWLSASGIALFTGAMGCSCVGFSGVVGLAIGFGAGLVPGIVQRLMRPR